jgi:hypothetical protein
MPARILDAYISTVSTDSFEASVITSSPDPVALNGKVLDAPGSSGDGKYFFRFREGGMPPAHPFQVEVSHGGDERILRGETLHRPAGRHRLRFGILADPHINTREVFSPLGPPEGTVASSHCRVFPSKRLHGKANELCRKYLHRLAELGAEFVILPGDIVESGSPAELAEAAEILGEAPLPCYPMIGNHEAWHSGTPQVFYRALDLPPGGYRAFTAGGVRFILLSTPEPDALGPGSRQLEWLKDELRVREENTLIFSHFSLLLHPCNEGRKNDGYQILRHSPEILDLLGRHPRVRAFIAGHKNVPSRILRDGIAHLLCPQLIQAPCAFDVVDLYDGGMVRMVHEIDEQHLLQRSRDAGGSRWWADRFGNEGGRNFTLPFSPF